MKKLAFPIVLMLVGCIVPTACIVKKVQFKQECSGYLKQAADANTPEIALDRINRALSYIEAHNLTEGYTSVLWRTEEENVGFWYENIKACKKELEECLDSSQLEKTNVLMKVRESLTDNGEKGTKLTIPYGIHMFPNNTLWAFLLSVSFIILVCSYLVIRIS